MWPFENPTRKKMKGIMAEIIELKNRIRAKESEWKELQEQCAHHHKTVVVNGESNEDWTACEDCGKLLYR